MPRSTFLADLQELENAMLKMGSLVEEAIARAIDSLVRQDNELARSVIQGDDRIDALQLEIEDRCLRLIALQQPLARDLRFIGTALKIVTDLERIADHAADIAQVALRLSGEPYIKPLIDIPRMAELARGMLRDSLTAYVQEDVDLAYSMADRDSQVDSLYNQVFRELLVFMMEDPRTIPQATRLLMVAQYLERVADHVTNLGE
ncbi:MAG TPA: phosphate transport system regulatory protein PhoU, partial [Clostridiales bacterium]|nr:phosphate transport system regulatory protein PhoU [Clostridiales bacterium]